MRVIYSCMAVITVALCVSAARAQSMKVDTGVRVTDLSLTPNANDMSDNQSVTGAATNTFLDAYTDNPFGNGSGTAKASGKAGVMKVYADSAYNYVIPAGNAGGYAESGASVDFTDTFTITSPTLAVGTLTTINFAYVVNGTVTVPNGVNEPPGFYDFANGYMRAQTNEDDQEATFDYPDNPLSNLGITVKAKVGESFDLRYELKANTYLDGRISDYRFIDCDFYNTAYIFANATDPNVSFTTASGYGYSAFTVVPESSAVLLFTFGFACLAGMTLRRVVSGSLVSAAMMTEGKIR